MLGFKSAISADTKNPIATRNRQKRKNFCGVPYILLDAGRTKILDLDFHLPLNKSEHKVLGTSLDPHTRSSGQLNVLKCPLTRFHEVEVVCH